MCFLFLGKTRLTIDQCIEMLDNSDIEDISDDELNDDDEFVEEYNPDNDHADLDDTETPCAENQASASASKRTKKPEFVMPVNRNICTVFILNSVTCHFPNFC